jgi:hypothetical protein
LEVLELEEIKELMVEIQFFLLLLLWEVEGVLEMVVEGLLTREVQVAEVRVVAQLVLMEHLDRVVRVETGLSILDAKAVEEAVELVLLVGMDQLAQ